MRQYEGIKGHKITKVKFIRNKVTGKEEHNDAVLQFIEKIHAEIYPLVLYEEQGFDVLGRFYREFVRYAGSDQATGLVLTPEHIADLFCDLVKLSDDDIVYDPCCGTGGFLIAALKRMISQSGNDVEKVKAIKESQFIGSEVRADMFTYACSSMMMRGDGKSQVYNEDCFASAQKRLIRSLSPTVAMLNPPYSKANGPANQLRFVLNALEDMATSGRCAAIVQMSCALTTKKDVVTLHKELLRRHRLDAVISMPDQLFYPIGVNTCAMVFTAHIPHPQNYPTWFGYLKDDGFIIHKKKGRLPIDWDLRRGKLLSVYQFYEMAGLSVRHEVGYQDEWCAEAYLETDFSILSRGDFARKLRKYLGHQYIAEKIASISSEPAEAKDLELQIYKWREFRFDEVFKIRKGYYNKKPPTSQTADRLISFIGATESNNGVTSMHDIEDVLLYSRNGEENPYESEDRKIFPGKCITVSNNVSVGNAFYQPVEFTCSHDINPLYLSCNKLISPEIGLFLSAIIEVDKYRWGYGRKWRPTRMPNSIIRLPVTEKGKPDWEFMENYMRSLDQSANLLSATEHDTAARADRLGPVLVD